MKIRHIWIIIAAAVAAVSLLLTQFEGLLLHDSTELDRLCLKDEVKLEIKVDDFEYKNDKLYVTSGQILVTTDTVNDSFLDGAFNIRHGNRVIVRGRLKRIKGPTNPGESDFSLYYKSKGITHRIWAEEIVISDERYNIFKYAVYKVRTALIKTIDENFELEDAGFYRAALLGDKTGLDDDLYDLYRRNGIAHLLAISGLHISIIGMSIYRLLRKLKLSFLKAGIIATGWLILYSLITGSGVSTVRAVIMMITVFVAELMGRNYDMLNAAGLAASGLMITNPYLIYNAGFLLSFGAVTAIGGPAMTILKELRLNKPKNLLTSLLNTLIVSFSIQLVTLPIILYFYFEIPLYGFIINLIVIPLMTYCVWSGLITVIFSFIVNTAVPLIAGSGHYILRFYSFVCNLTDRLPYHNLLLGRPKLWQIGVYYFLLFFLLYLFPYLREKLKSHFST